MRASDLKKALRVRYAPPEWVVLEEVRSHTGHKDKPTYADAFAMSTYPSRGLQTIGFEVKVSRQDWLQELKNPDKADNIGKYCDLWYVVTHDAKILTLDEVPANWGVLVYKTDRFRVLKEAVRTESVPLTRDFVAALLRNHQKDSEDWVHKDHVDAEVQRQVTAEVEVAVRLATRSQGHDTAALSAYQEINNVAFDNLRMSVFDIVRALKESEYARVAVEAANDARFRDQSIRVLERERAKLLKAAEAIGLAHTLLTKTPESEDPGVSHEPG